MPWTYSGKKGSPTESLKRAWKLATVSPFHGEFLCSKSGALGLGIGR